MTDKEQEPIIEVLTKVISMATATAAVIESFYKVTGETTYHKDSPEGQAMLVMLIATRKACLNYINSVSELIGA